ncbi:AbrB family transcriptional regulator [Pseudooceanicola aestuarii]|uniref:AbrB family transcriptional regulator n=1 Tax=Pseudooceanicola aestuarii TaxID=2697319 RepID=UPI0013D3250A|nr:AbrB family transcriptional regulator [Pseudooceanicola aestuarii]
MAGLVSNPAVRGLLTLATGAAGGLLFFALNLPLPWVLGAMFANALVAQVTPFEPRLPGAWRGYAMIGIGTMLGTGFTPDVIARAHSWIPSLVAMCLLSLVFCLMAYWIFRGWGRMDRMTALFSAMPGGLSVVTMLAEDYKTEVNRVVLSHTARLVVLLISAPILIQLMTGIDLAEANHASFAEAEPLDPLRHGAMAVVAVACWWLGQRIRFPSALLLFPLFASAGLHMTGVLTVHVPPLLSAGAQIVIGGSVGARFASYTLRQIARDGGIAALIGLVLALGSLGAAWAVAPLIDASVAPLFLAYLPGGAPELGVVALALAIDPAMVAAHHVLRVFLIVAALPLAAARAGRRKSGAE